MGVLRRKKCSPSTRMKAAMMILVLVLSLISTTVASTKDEKDVLGCSADQLLSCITEIEQPLEQHRRDHGLHQRHSGRDQLSGVPLRCPSIPLLDTLCLENLFLFKNGCHRIVCLK